MDLHRPPLSGVPNAGNLRPGKHNGPRQTVKHPRASHMGLARVSAPVSSGVARDTPATHESARPYIEVSPVSGLLTNAAGQTLYEIVAYSAERASGLRALVWALDPADLERRVSVELPSDYALDVYFPHHERRAFVPAPRED